jgi:DNA-binding beta-propeller fold protein YncE
MRRVLLSLLLGSAMLVTGSGVRGQTAGQTAPVGPGDGGYRLVPNWPTLPPDMFFGLKDMPLPPAEREAQAAARRARGGNRGGGQNQNAGGGAPRGGGGGGVQTPQPGISGLAIDAQDRIYVFNRGAKPIMIFDRDGKLLRSGGDQELFGVKLNPNWQHSGTVDWEGNVYMIERDAHRIVKLNPALDKALLQLGTTGERGNDATHFGLPSGIAVLRNGNIIVTDGYTNNRVVMFAKDGTFIKQVAKGAGGQQDRGTGPGEWNLPHKLAVDAQENLYIIDREGHRVQVFDKDLNYLRELKNEGWNPWDIGISRKGDDGFALVAEYAGERVHKIQTRDGKIVATWGSMGHGPGQFDWVHGVVVDSRGAVYAADTYGQRLQKFVPAR